MNYTENYQLPQWEENDLIQRTDFNTAMDTIDQGMQYLQELHERSEEDRAQAEYFLREDVNRIISRVDGDIAQITPFFGTYTGSGHYMVEDHAVAGKEVVLGFRPKLVIIGKGWLYQSYMHHGFYVAMEPMLEEAESVFRFTDTGFLVGITSKDYNAMLNEAGTVYPFVAFR